MSNSLRRFTLLLAGTSLLAACATAPRSVAIDPAPAPALAVVANNEPVPVSTLVSQVAIPHEGFRLANGLTVLVHEDRKAPVVAVSMWYNVGSKDEPAGKTGFAHLFEHLMFNGSENLPGDFFTYLQQIGATGYQNTEIGQIIVLAYLDAYTKLVTELGGLPANAAAAAPQAR